MALCIGIGTFSVISVEDIDEADYLGNLPESGSLSSQLREKDTNSELYI